MSPPPPVTDQVPLDRFWPPGPGVTVPMSAQFQLDGQMPGGANSVAVTSTELSVTAEPVPWLCEVMAKPASSDPFMDSTCVDPGTAVQVLPSGDV